MNTLFRTLLSIVLLIGAMNAKADLEIFKDYDLGSEILSMSMVKVDANRGDAYLEGLRETWVKSNQIQKELGHIKDYQILVSDLPQGGEFNMILIVQFKKTEDLEPSKRRYEQFMKKWGEKAADESREISKDYHKVRSIVGEYRFRELNMK